MALTDTDVSGKKSSSRSVGSKYEAYAAAYLESLGYRLIARNFRCRSGEIDLIASDEGVLVFAEVKYRADDRRGGPFAAVNYHKQAQISRTALYYLMTHGLSADTPCRFDVVGITGKKIELIKDAFPFRR